MEMTSCERIVINKTAAKVARSSAGITLVLWALIALYAGARVLQVFPGKVPMRTVVALHVLPPLVFALIHGAMAYRVRGILTFVALYVMIGNIFENVGVLTGFPFGHYFFTEVMGPKIFQVPIFLGLAYVGMGYLAWTLARVILRDTRGILVGSRIVTLPLVAASIMVAWDLAMDPVWATIVHAWIWVRGGAYFGVPVSNFFGWYLTVYISYQLFALYLRGSRVNANPLPSGYLRLGVVFYGVSAAGNAFLVILPRGPLVVTDPAGTQWNVAAITAACALVSIFIMGAITLLAWSRIKDIYTEV